jgi:hypothetical protein
MNMSLTFQISPLGYPGIWHIWQNQFYILPGKYGLNNKDINMMKTGQKKIEQLTTMANSYLIHIY